MANCGNVKNGQKLLEVACPAKVFPGRASIYPNLKMLIKSEKAATILSNFLSFKKSQVQEAASDSRTRKQLQILGFRVQGQS